MLLRRCSPASGHCHDEHDDHQFPRKRSQPPPIYIGSVAFDSQFLLLPLLVNRTVTRYRAGRSASRLRKCGAEFHRSWISAIHVVCVHLAPSWGNVGSADHPRKWKGATKKSTSGPVVSPKIVTANYSISQEFWVL